MSLIVLGTVALDTVKTPFGKRALMLGGSAAHFSMSARLFTRVHLVATVGEDFPDAHLAFLRAKGLALDALTRDKGTTFKWEGKYEGDLNSAHTLNTELGVLLTFKPAISEAQRRIPYVFLANVDPDIQRHLLEKMRNPRLVGLDSMNFWINNKRRALLRVLRKVDIYLVNDQEARLLSQEASLIKAVKKLHSLGPRMILLKKGEHGSLCYCNKFVLALPAFPIERVIDPTGAGDTFAGAFMGYLTRAKKINPGTVKRAIAFGTVAASFNVQDFGLRRTARMTLKDLTQRLGAFRKCSSF